MVTIASAAKPPVAGRLIVAMIAAAAVGPRASEGGDSHSRRPYLNYTGDVMLGALFPVHRKGSWGADCGRIQPEDGIQPLEAMVYALQQINKDNKLLPGVNLGLLAFDSCDNPAYALEQSLDFVKGFIAHFNEYHESEFQCLDGSTPKFRGGGFDQVVAVIGGQSSSVTIQVATMLRLFKVPQVSYLSTSPSLSNRDRFPYFFRTVPSDVNQAHVMLTLLSHFNWTYVSVVYSNNEYGNHGFETLSALAKNYSVCFSSPQRIDKERFTDKDFDRVIHTLINNTEVRVVVIFAERATAVRLLDASKRIGVFSRFIWIGSDAWTSRSGHLSSVTSSSTRVPPTAYTTDGTTTVGTTTRYPLAEEDHSEVGAEDASSTTTSSPTVQYHEPMATTASNSRRWMDSVLEGALAVQPLVRPLTGFDKYFTSLTPETHSKFNPWFSEFWEETFRCRMTSSRESTSETHSRGYANVPGEEEDDQDDDDHDVLISTSPSISRDSPHQLFASDSNHPRSHHEAPEERIRVARPKRRWPPCDPSLRLSTSKGYKQQRYLHFVRDAVYSIAHALHNMFVDKCGPNYYGLCEATKHIEGEDLKEYIANVSFRDVGGKVFTFKDGRDGPPRYSILNFQRDDTAGGFLWKPVGNYSIENGSHVINMDHDAIRFRQGEVALPSSSCGHPCQFNQVKIRNRVEDICCWRCRDCSIYQFKKDEFHCEDCPNGQLPNEDRTGCDLIPEKIIDFRDPWALGAMAISLFGIAVTIGVGIVFWIYGDTPVIKASGRELSCLLLLGTLASFLVTFVLVGATPTPFSCGLSRFSLGLCHSLCYAAILTKTNRIARIFNHNHSTPHKPKYTSPQSQLIITGLLTSVEVVVSACWLVSNPPAVTYVFPDRETRLRICLGLSDHSYMVGLAYPLFLVLLCVVYAARTRKCPGGFNEARYVAFTSYTAIVVWLAFVPLYLASTSHSIRVVTLAISLSLSGLVQLGCLFFPKMYIVLLKPEKNTKEVVMSQHRSSSYAATSPPNSNPTVIVNGGRDFCPYLRPHQPHEPIKMQELGVQQYQESSPKIWRLTSACYIPKQKQSHVEINRGNDLKASPQHRDGRGSEER